MLKTLQIQNIILIENAHLTFGASFNALTGETGSGKSAILQALNLIAGERAESNLLRKDCEQAFITATFDISALPQLATLLEESGIQHNPSEELIVRREIVASGKNRAFVNQQPVQITLLKKMSTHLMEMIGQHANQRLLEVNNHRIFLDLYGQLTEKATIFGKNWIEETRLQQHLNVLMSQEAEQLREMAVCEMELEELETAMLKEGEEETLFAEYSRLSHSEELLSKTSEIVETLSGEKVSVLSHLKKHISLLQQLERLDNSLKSTTEAYQQALLELQEISYTLNHYLSSIQHNPERTAQIAERLKVIDKLKKRYGNSFPEILRYQQQKKARLEQLQNRDQEIETLQAALKAQKETNDQLSKELTQQRKTAAKKLEKAVERQLHELNMAKTTFQCLVTQSSSRGKSGDDFVEFYLTPNVGEKPIPVSQCASGGEMSRLLLALQTVLAGKEAVSTLIFDEIDSNIGGQTASIIGEKLKALGKQHQLICITHFPQVAKQADYHLYVHKEVTMGRTLTHVKMLDATSREKELTRMSGMS